MRVKVGFVALVLLAACASTAPRPPDPPNTVNDVTQLNPIAVERIVEPKSVEEIGRLVAGHGGPISIGGGRFSQGGQTACTGCLFLDMKGMNRVLNLDQQAKTITVEAGATWRQLQEFLDQRGGQGMVSLEVYLDSRVILRTVSEASADGRLRIDAKSVR